MWAPCFYAFIEKQTGKHAGVRMQQLNLELNPLTDTFALVFTYLDRFHTSCLKDLRSHPKLDVHWERAVTNLQAVCGCM